MMNHLAKKATDISKAQPTRHRLETYSFVSAKKQKLIDAESKVDHIILTRIDNDSYSTVDAFSYAKERWLAIEHLMQGENINEQDVETNLFLASEKFTSRDARNANLLVLIAATHHQPYYNPQLKLNYNPLTSTTRSQAATRGKGKEIARAPSLPPNLEHEVVNDEEDTLRDKEIVKLMDLISTSFKNIYKPANNNLRTLSNTMNNVDNTLRRSRYERKIGKYENQRVVNVAWNKDKLGNKIVQQIRIQCYYCKGFRHTARECMSTERVKDSSYHKGKIVPCEQEEAWV
nr:hypothetical protein [Tanacetum cinerariifolium]